MTPARFASGCRCSNLARAVLVKGGAKRTRTPDLFHAIDSRPVWWTGPEAGDWSPESSVDRDCASRLVSSLVISVVVKLTFSLRKWRQAQAPASVT